MTPLARLTAPFARLAAPLGRIKVNRGWLVYAGYSAFFLACFVLFALIGFPYDRLRTFLQQEVARAWPPAAPGAAPTRLVVGDIGATWSLGIGLDDVRVEQDPPQPGRVPVTIALDALTIHPSLLSLVFGRTRVGFNAAVGGSIEGTFTASGSGWDLDAELDEVDLAKLGLGGVLGLPVAGSASGRIELASTEEPNSEEGAVVLHVEGFVLGDGKVKMPIPGFRDGLTVAPINSGTLDLKIAVHQGVAAIEKFEARGEDIRLDGGGSVRLGRPFDRSRLDLTFEVKFTDVYKNRNDTTRKLFVFLDTEPMLKRATSADGSIRFALSGTPKALHTRPAGATAAAARATRRSAKPKGPQ